MQEIRTAMTLLLSNTDVLVAVAVVVMELVATGVYVIVAAKV
jgi:uncharacterized membrane protein (DUF485 family)